MSESFDLESPDHFTAGAVGQPGQRVFYLQARQGRTLLTLKAEKEQVAALGEYLAKLLEQGSDVQDPPADAPGLLDPVAPAWTVGSLGLGYDEASQRILLIASELTEEDEEEDEPAPPPDRAAKAETGASARILITRAQAAAFVARARALVAAGRPICPMCTRPMSPAGHVCPRSNGHGTDPA